MKNLPEKMNRAMRGKGELLEQFLLERPPREIPPELRSTATPVGYKLRILFMGLGAFLTVGGALLILMLLPPVMLFSISVLPLMFVAGVILFLIGGKMRNDSLEILRNGKRYDAEVIGIASANMRSNGVNYFWVTLSFRDESGTQREVRDLITYQLADYLAGLQDSPEPSVDILFTPSVENKGIVLLKYVFAVKFDPRFS